MGLSFRKRSKTGYILEVKELPIRLLLPLDLGSGL